MIIRFLAAAALLALSSAAVRADIAGTDRTGDIDIFAFTCFTTKVCSTSVPINSAGTEIFTDSNPGVVTGVGVDDSVAYSDETGSVVMCYAETTPTAVTSGDLAFMSCDPVTRALRMRSTSEYPMGAVPLQDSDTGTTSATASTLAGTASYTTYVCGFSIRANATAAVTGNSTLSDATWTLNFTQWTAPLASGIGITEMIFSPCKPASAANTGITVTSAAPGSGGVVSTAIWGYRIP